MKRAALLFLLVLLALGLAGCQTTKGIGKDLQKAGEWIEQKAD